MQVDKPTWSVYLPIIKIPSMEVYNRAIVEHPVDQLVFVCSCNYTEEKGELI